MSYRKIFLSLFTFYVMGMGFSFAQHLMHYTSERFEYSLLIPEDWRRNDELKGENLAMVMVSPDDASMSISFYSLKGMDENEFIEQYQHNLEKQLIGISIREKGVFKSRDDEATYLLFDYDKNEIQYTEKLSFYKRKKEMAVLVVSHSKEKFHEIIPVIEKVFASFTFETKQDKVDDLD